MFQLLKSIEALSVIVLIFLSDYFTRSYNDLHPTGVVVLWENMQLEN